MPRRIAALAVALTFFALPHPSVAADANADPAAMPAGSYVIDPHHASLLGSVSHFGRSTYVFRFDRVDARYDYDPAAPDAAKITVNVDVNSLNTGWDKADRDFARDFMGAAKTPMATFVSTRIEHTGPTGTVTGDLTLNGVTKPLTLNVTFLGYGPLGPMGVMGRKAGFAAKGVINRSDYGLDKFIPMVGDAVTLEFNGEFSPSR